jgi:hypothetical protein
MDDCLVKDTGGHENDFTAHGYSGRRGRMGRVARAAVAHRGPPGGVPPGRAGGAGRRRVGVQVGPARGTRLAGLAPRAVHVAPLRARGGAGLAAAAPEGWARWARKSRVIKIDASASHDTPQPATIGYRIVPVPAPRVIAVCNDARSFRITVQGGSRGPIPNTRW